MSAFATNKSWRWYCLQSNTQSVEPSITSLALNPVNLFLFTATTDACWRLSEVRWHIEHTSSTSSSAAAGTSPSSVPSLTLFTGVLVTAAVSDAATSGSMSSAGMTSTSWTFSTRCLITTFALVLEQLCQVNQSALVFFLQSDGHSSCLHMIAVRLCRTGAALLRK